MDRRSFLKSSLLASSSLVLPPAFAATSSNSNSNNISNEYKLDANGSYRLTNNILPLNSKQQEDFWNKPRRIFLKRNDTGEQSEIIYYKNGNIDQKQYWLASYLLRDIRQKKMVYMDPKLLDLMCAVQAWLVYYGYSSPLLVMSGFRTVATNSNLEGAARNSMHLYGKAIDFRVPQLNVNSIAQIADQFNAGGIGLYPSSNFLHLDTGGVRKWVGSKNKKA